MPSAGQTAAEERAAYHAARKRRSTLVTKMRAKGIYEGGSKWLTILGRGRM